MKALIRKPFHYATRDWIAGGTIDLPDAVFAEFKRERLVTEAPPEELPLAMPAEVAVPKSAPAPIAAPTVAAKPAAAPAKSKRK